MFSVSRKLSHDYPKSFASCLAIKSVGLPLFLSHLPLARWQRWATFGSREGRNTRRRRGTRESRWFFLAARSRSLTRNKYTASDISLQDRFHRHEFTTNTAWRGRNFDMVNKRSARETTWKRNVHVRNNAIINTWRFPSPLHVTQFPRAVYLIASKIRANRGDAPISSRRLSVTTWGKCPVGYTMRYRADPRTRTGRDEGSEQRDRREIADRDDRRAG